MPEIVLTRPTSLFPGAQYAYAATVPVGARLVFAAGACPLDADGTTVAVRDYAGQAGRVMANLQTTLEDAGSGLAHVVRTTVYVVSAQQDDLVAAWRVVRGALEPHEPPSTLVGVAALGYTGQLVEVEAIAVAPGPGPDVPVDQA